MKRQNIAGLTTAAIAVMLTLAAGISVADDTEIFEALPPTGADNRPNVLLIIDTSFSMTGTVTTQVDWDPTVTFPGKTSDNCDVNYIYWQSTAGSGLPSCTGTSQQRISKTNLVCQANLGFTSTTTGGGQVTMGKTLQWKDSGTKKWEALKAGRDTYVECDADHLATGTHSGLVAGDNKVATDGNSGPFNTSSAITNWGSTSYTFYTGNRLNYLKNGTTTTRTRMQIVQQASKDMLDQLLDGSVNVGLMRFQAKGYGSGHAQGGYVLHELGPIENVRSAIKSQINALTAVSYTPLTETMFEAWRYYSGGAVKYGNNATNSYSVAASRQTLFPNVYKSPLANACQTNYIVLLTDGESTGDDDADTDIVGLSQFSKRRDPNVASCSANVTTSGDGDGTGVCLDDLAEYMFKRPDIAAEADKIGKEIHTYTIGFGDAVASSANLKSAALLGGGQSYTANDSASLATALSNVLRNIISTNVTFTSPTISVNAFNRTRNLNDLFFTVFQPSDEYHWPGNIKKYHIRPDGILIDSDGYAAVDNATGFFSKTAKSYWSNVVDGDDVNEGGAANEIPNGGSNPGPALRNVYTDIAAYSGTPVKNLAATNNEFSISNTALTTDPTVIGLPAGSTTAEIEELITWARGQVSETSTATPPVTTISQRYEMGDPLHSRPVAAIYGGSATAPDLTVFAATNDGYLHAIDADDGKEIWSFIPSELLGRLEGLKRSNPPAAVASKQYGIDGSITLYQTDTGVKGVVDGTDKVILYFGMGRGGSNYYAIDVTDRANPTLLWRNGASATMTGLGQSWSTPNIVTINVDGTITPVMVVAGGYDATQDDVAISIDDTGNRLFILNALTGAVIWHAGPTSVTGAGYDNTAEFTSAKMLYSIPADLRVVDTGTDGLADRMYVGDMGGQIWRFDIINGQPAASLVRGGVIASLGAAAGSGGTSPTDARRFYSAPDVSFVSWEGQRFLNIAIGSGFRGHPLNTQIRDRFYSLHDPKPATAMTATEYSSFSVITDTSYSATNTTGLYNLTDDSSPTATVDPDIPSTVRGWKLHLRKAPTVYEGEKVLGESRTFANTIFFSSFTPNNSVAASSCTVRSGSNKLYSICLSGECRRKEIVLQQAGIAPEPVIVRPDINDPGPTCTAPDGCPPPVDCTGAKCNKPFVLIGAESVDAELKYEAGRVFWKANE